MQSLIVKGDEDKRFRVYYNAQPISIFVGVAERSNARYATIDFSYAPDILPTILSIVQHSNFSSYVFIDQKEGKLAVLFQVKDVTLEDLDSWEIPQEQWDEVVREGSGKEIELIIITDTDFPSKDLEPFLSFFWEQGSFHLCITSQGEEGVVEIYWRAQLYSWIMGPIEKNLLAFIDSQSG